MRTTATDLHRTNEEVMESGSYVCEAGVKRELQRGDKFPVCPRTGNETSWRHSDHQHKTGDRVTEAGQYTDPDGEKINLSIGDTFPVCPRTGNSTSWRHV